MMTATLRIALILVSVGTLFLMMRKIRQSKLQIENAIFWIVLALVLVVFSVFPSVADFASRLVGVYATTNFLFVFAIFILIVKVFYMTLHISQLETKIKELTQKIALAEKQREEQQERTREEEERREGRREDMAEAAKTAKTANVFAPGGIHEETR